MSVLSLHVVIYRGHIKLSCRRRTPNLKNHVALSFFYSYKEFIFGFNRSRNKMLMLARLLSVILFRLHFFSQTVPIVKLEQRFIFHIYLFVTFDWQIINAFFQLQQNFFYWFVLFADLKSKLEKFVTDETNKLHDENSQKALQRLKNGDINIDDVVTKWHKAFTEV